MRKFINSTKNTLVVLLLLMTAIPAMACNINISASATTICSGTQITFTGVTSNASYRITYQWEKNGVPMTGPGNSGAMGSNPPNTIPGDSTFTFTTDGFSDGDVVTCYITESYANFTNTSSGITINVSNQAPVSSNFNGTSISSGNYVWFSSVLNVTGSQTYPMTIYFTNQSISSSSFTLAIPDGELILSNTYSTASTTYNGTMWVTTAPPNQSGNYFISGYAYQLSSSLAGGLNPVSWTGTFLASQSGVTLNWQWAAAVYTSFNSNLNNLGVKASDCSSCTSYSNSDHAGTPESYKSNVIGGARGGGGSNYTGSYSATGSITTCSAVTPSVSISGTTTICSGTSVTFTATPTNGGSSPSYQWKKNGNNVGTNSSTYTDNSLANGDAITCVITSNNPSAAPTTATSNSLTITVNNNVSPSVSIGENPGSTICSGTSVTFTATPTNGGASPSYQWKLNGNNIGANSATYTNSSLNNNDVVSVVMTSNASCVSPTTASNSVTMTVNSVTPSISISGTSTICSGTTVTFTATPANGGTSPVYQWKKNGNNVGTNSATYTDNSLANSDAITCVLTSNATCASPSTATSNTVTMTVNANLTPSISISGTSTICSGTSVSFTATPTNGGVAPAYQWKKNGNNVGTNSATYTDNGLANSDAITCVLTSNATCASPAIATSNTVTMTVNQNLTPSLSISGTSTICSGTSVTFTATPTNGGSSPAYQWKKNGVNVGTNSNTYSNNSLANSDAITCVLTSNATCASPTTATSNTLTMTVNANLTPAVSISGNSTICSGTSVTFTATPTNGGGAPAYQWKKNGNNVGTNSTTYTDNSLANSDVITCVLTSNATCASPATATSNSVTMTVNPNLTPSVSISGTSSICSGTSVTFTATPTNGGASPSYQWKKNGNNVGTNSTSYTDNSLLNSDAITCVLTSNATCATPTTATSNTVTMTVNANLTPSVSISGTSTICAGTSVTFTATPTNGGSTPAYQWKKNGVNVGTNSSTYTYNGFANSDVITCVLTSNATCASPTTATSNSITMTVNSILTPSVSISGTTTICTGTSVTFTATPTNGGATPSYQWTKNNTNVGANSSTYTDIGLANGDVISCYMTSNATCASPTTATSNTLTMTVNTGAAEPGAFTASSAITYQGQTSVTYTVPSVGGVTYSWSYSGTGATITGTGNSVTVSFSTSATSGSLCVTASNGSCGASPSRCISITVKPYLTWNCSVSNDWNTPANWDGGFVPYATISVLIPSGVCNPNICAANASANNVTINSGATVNICCSYEMDVKGNFTNNGSVLGCGYVAMVDSCHIIHGNGRVDNLEMRSGCAVCNTTINSGDTLHIGKTYKPTSGTLVTNGGLELLSDSSATAVVLSHGNVCGSCNTYISGDVILDKYIHGGQRAFRFFGHPFTSAIPLSQLTPYIDITGQGGSANGFSTTLTNNPSAFWYNTLTGNGSASNDSTGWTAFTNTNGTGANAWNRFEGVRILVRGTLGQGLGCSACVPSPVTIKMHGPVNECDEVVSCATNSNVGYNFISNPFPSDIDLSLCTRGSSVGANFAVWDPNQGTYGAYVSQPFSASYILPSMSAFFTTCTANTNNTITFHESDKTAAAPTGTLFKTTSGFGNDVLQLHIMSNHDSLSWDRLLLFFNGQALSAIDPLDAQKIYNPGLSFYSFSSDAQQLSVDVRPYSGADVIQLGVQNADAGDYTLRVDDYDVPAGATLYLHDKYLNQLMPLSQGIRYDFSVTSDPASQGDNRFEINMAPAGIKNVNADDNFKVSMVPNPATDHAAISFSAPASGSTSVRIANIMGQEVFAADMGFVQSGKVNLPLSNLASGMYLVTIKCGELSVTKRLVKQ